MATKEATLQQRIETAANTLDSGDAERMADLYTRDGQLLPPGVEAVAGRDAIAAFWHGVFEAGVGGVALEPVEVEEHGDTAIEVGRVTIDDTNGETMDRGKYLVVWKREDDEWKLHRDIWNSSGADEQ